MRADELIEAMARAMFKPDQLNRLDIAKAMLAIARPIIEAQERERCASFVRKWFGEGSYKEAGVALAAALKEPGNE